MKKKLLDRRGAAIELAIMMMVFSIFITTIVLTTALLQNDHKAKAELGIRQDIFLEQLGEDFVAAVLSGNLNDWEIEYDGVTIDKGTVVKHIWVKGETVNPTCETEGYVFEKCTLCNETRVKDVLLPKEHNIENIVEEELPTCTKTGKKVGFCTLCQQNVTITIPTKEHTVTLIEQKAVTCTEDGYEKYVCAVCGEEESVIFAAGHISGEIKELTSPTCTQAGMITHICSVCGESYTEIGAEATGHSYGEVTADQTQIENCQGTQICTVCGDVKLVENHNWGELQGSCTENITAALTCAVCRVQQEVEIPATGHKFGEDSICTECGINRNENRYNLIVLRLTKDTYLLHTEKIEAGVTVENENTEIVDGEEVCPSGGTVVLKITVSQIAGTYTITEWSKK